VADRIEQWRTPAEVRTVDGAALRSYTAGEPGGPAAVIASACGMPAALCEGWLRFLSRDHRALTWETRGLFGQLGGAESFDRIGHDVAAQAEDLIAVMDHHGLASAHVMGLCGGAVVALRAAATWPDRISSLSLWHGDYELGLDCPKTTHQHNLKALMAMAAESRADAATIRTALHATARASVPAEFADLVLYPYLSAELFYRYCVLTGAIMAADVAGLLGAVRLPTLVVTSQDDQTAHPAGSHRVAAALPGAVLRVEPHGDHISVFGASPRLQRILTDFLAALQSERVA
jgi:pimeloyl-ACP methyl ester carboxylesterase